MTDLAPRRLTYAQARAVLNCSYRALRRLIDDGEINATNSGTRAVRITRDSIERYLAREDTRFVGKLRRRGAA